MNRGLLNRRIGRRDFLKTAAAVTAATALPAGLLDLRTAFAAGALRTPGSLPFPDRPAGIPHPDLAPELANIEHFILVMMENHSFDNYFGMLPYRHPSLAGRVDGWPGVDASGIPTATQVDNNGVTQHCYPMADGCQPKDVSQSWSSSHKAYNHGAMDGFLRESSVQALGYWDQQILPFYYSLASQFPVCDRYFSSTLCQTYPNRVFSMAATACGLISTDTPPPEVTPPNGRIFDVLNAHNIGWIDYWSELPSPGLLGKVWAAQQQAEGHMVGPLTPPAVISAFQAACTAGTLPPVVMLEPDYQWGSEENPQNIQVGQWFVAGVINALMNSPMWSSSMLVFTYDEHGGYYDHVPPPAALNPGDGFHPSATDWYGDDYTQLGFRVPAVIISPWAKSGFTSHTVYDHTSWLATIERKWNLPALTYRDANANALSDCLVSSGPAPFAEPPALAAAPFRTEADSIVCEQYGSDPLAPATLPEVPAAALLPLAGAVAGGAAYAIRKRTRAGVAD